MKKELIQLLTFRPVAVRPNAVLCVVIYKLFSDHIVGETFFRVVFVMALRLSHCCPCDDMNYSSGEELYCSLTCSMDSPRKSYMVVGVVVWSVSSIFSRMSVIVVIISYVLRIMLGWLWCFSPSS